MRTTTDYERAEYLTKRAEYLSERIVELEDRLKKREEKNKKIYNSAVKDCLSIIDSMVRESGATEVSVDFLLVDVHNELAKLKIGEVERCQCLQD